MFLYHAETPVGCGAAYLVKGRIFVIIVIIYFKQIARDWGLLVWQILSSDIKVFN